MEFTPCKTEQSLRGMKLQEKEAQKDNRIQEISLEEPTDEMSLYSRLKATKIMGQRKAFYRQRIPEFSCARKETVDIDILVTSRNGDKKIMQSIRIRGRPISRKK